MKAKAKKGRAPARGSAAWWRAAAREARARKALYRRALADLKEEHAELEEQYKAADVDRCAWRDRCLLLVKQIQALGSYCGVPR